MNMLDVDVGIVVWSFMFLVYAYRMLHGQACWGGEANNKGMVRFEL